MNPFNNRWFALTLVAGILLVVAELVGTGEDGGILSRTAQSFAGGGEQLPDVVVPAVVPPEVAAQPAPVVVVDEGGDEGFDDDFSDDAEPAEESIDDSGDADPVGPVVIVQDAPNQEELQE